MKPGVRAVAIAMLAAGIGWTLLSAQPGPGAYAQPAGTSKAKGTAFGPCQEDVQRLCPDVKPGQGRMARCLNQNEADLSPACREFQKEKRAEFRTARPACVDDMKRLCAGVRPGQGRIAKCLKRHEADLSPACKQELAAP